MALRYLLDTNTVSFLIRRSSPALERHFKKTAADEAALSVVREMEIRFGLARNTGLRIASLVESFLAGMTILPLTPTSLLSTRGSARRWRRKAHRSARTIS